MRPSDAVAYRRILIDLSRRVVGEHFDQHERRLVRDGGPGLTPDFREFCLELSHFLPHAPAYYVSSEMVAVAREASKTLPIENLDETVIPDEAGFMLFDGPITGLKFDDGTLSVIGIAWSYSDYGPGHHISDLNADECSCPDEGFDPGCPQPMMSGKEVRFYPCFMHDGIPVPCGGYNWHVGDPYYEAGSGDIIVAENDSAPLESGAPVLAAWVLMQQSITQVERTYADRPERRRCMRAALPSDLCIVRLRRIDAHDQDAGSGEIAPWSHRWLVSGHWRQQFYPSRGSNSTIWIGPHVKGPSDKPLLLKEKVTAWVR